MTELSAQDVIRLLGLKPHPEGGHFRETFRDGRTVGGRAASTAIFAGFELPPEGFEPPNLLQRKYVAGGAQK